MRLPRLLLLALLAPRPAPTAQHLCARLPLNATCLRFSSLTALLPDAFSCAPPGEDLLSVASPPATLKPSHHRTCADWDGLHSDACAHAPALLWESVLLALPADDAPAWFAGPVQRATLLLLSSTGAPTGHARVLRAPMAEGVRLYALLLSHAPPDALFALLLRDANTTLHPSSLFHLLRSAELALGTQQAYRLAGSPLHASSLQVLSLPALRSLAAGNVSIPTLHCGHILSDGSAYSRGADEGTLLAPSPLPGNPVAVGGGGASDADGALCPLPSTTGDPWCAALHAPHHHPRAGGALSVDLVLSHWKESAAALRLTIDTVRAARPEARVWLYSKGGAEAAAELVTALAPDVFRLVLLPNVGREGHTYLSHITAQYNSLADVTIFSQADGGGTRQNPDARFALAQRLPLLTNRTGMLNLGGTDRSGCEGSPAFPFTRLRELWALTQHRLCPYVRQATYLSFMNGLFAVSAGRVRGQPLQLYSYLLSLMDAPPEHFSHADAVDAFSGIDENKVGEFTFLDGGFTDALGERNHNAASYFSYMMERGWNLVFSCVREQMRCCSGPGGACEPGDCQCEDG